MAFILETTIALLIIIGISTVGKSNSLVAAIIAGLPSSTVLGMIWIYRDTKEVSKVINLSKSVSLIIIPSFIFYYILPVFLKKEFNFYLSLALALAFMLIGQFIFIKLVNYLTAC